MEAAVAAVFIWLLGLCVGSFLNVVVYRLPAGGSISDPPRSFCPLCKTSIRWYDNIPVLSWLLLRARCRHCHAPISVQYPVVEALTGLVFVLTYHLLFVANARVGVTCGWPQDVPLLIAWLVLAAALIACSAMDLTMYMVDTRVTDVALAAAIMLHAVWPRQALFEPQAGTPLAAAAVAAFVVSGIMLWLTVWRASDPAEDEQNESADETDDPPQATSSGRGLATAGLLATVLFVVLALWTATGFAPSARDQLIRLGPPISLLAIFVVTALAGGQPRSADEEIHNAIEEEQPHARRMALRELLWLCPAIIAAVAVYAVVSRLPAAERAWTAAIHWPAASTFAPLGGIVFAVYGAIVGAAAGWALRIVFTLAFGREAFGTGDIYILAAAGAAAGWDIVLIGLLAAVGLALLGWLLALLFKRGTMIPFGPWLAIGFLAALWLSHPASDHARRLFADLHVIGDLPTRNLLLLVGALLVISVFAIGIARLIRVGLERSLSGDHKQR